LRAFEEEHGCAYGDTLTPHPYLAFVQRALPGCVEVINVGINGPDYPIENDEDTFVIMLTGGSVAAQLARMKTGSFEQVLNTRYGTGGMRFVVLNGALPAWKQPQQLIMLLLYGDVIDAVVTLDGFNELVFAHNDQYRYRLENPWEPSILAANPSLATRDQLLAWWLNDWIHGLSRDHRMTDVPLRKPAERPARATVPLRRFPSASDNRSRRRNGSLPRSTPKWLRSECKLLKQKLLLQCSKARDRMASPAPGEWPGAADQKRD